MTNDAEWVEDVKRWVAGARATPAAITDAAEGRYLMPLGYEAAHPALQALHWPDALGSSFDDIR